jgi:hypothetical protein
MYPENGTNGIDNQEIPFSEPQSPTVPHLRHHQPTTDDNPDNHTSSGLRHRHAPNRTLSPGGVDSSSMRIQIQTPFSDLGESSENAGGRRKELVVDRTMRGFELKDGLAGGKWGDEGWVRDGMRLVWRGRIVRDEEELGQVVKDVSPQQVDGNGTD